MKISLSNEEKKALEVQHVNARDRRIADRIKSVLLRSEGWSIGKIAQALRLHNDTVGRYISDYLQDGTFEYHHKGSTELLTKDQSEKLIKHVEDSLYEKVVEIVAYVKTTFDVDYTVSGMTAWLRRNGFSYKQPTGRPAKADTSRQIAFAEEYSTLKTTATNGNEPIVFIDGVHPTMQSKAAHGWIKTGKEKILPTTASRTRINLMGAIELATMVVITREYKTINGDAIINFLDAIKATYSEASTVHVILDQAGYHRSDEVKAHAEKIGVTLHYLPPYSPNLNPIERLWKVMNERVRNNRFFETAKEFKVRIKAFFDDDLPEISAGLGSRINDNFHIPNTAK